MRQFVYTRLDAFTVLILLGTRLHTSQVKRAWLMPSLRSDRHVHTLNQSLWFLSECRSVWRDVDFLIYFAPTIIKTALCFFELWCTEIVFLFLTSSSARRSLGWTFSKLWVYWFLHIWSFRRGRMSRRETCSSCERRRGRSLLFFYNLWAI